MEYDYFSLGTLPYSKVITIIFEDLLKISLGIYTGKKFIIVFGLHILKNFMSNKAGVMV